MNTALIIVDFQFDFLEEVEKEHPGTTGPMSVFLSDTAEAVEQVICTQSIHPPDHFSFAEFGPHCVKGTRGAKIPHLVHDLADYTATKGDALSTDNYSAFEARTLRPLEYVETILKIHDIERVCVAGLGHGWDVPQTAYDANALGYSPVVLLDGTRPLSPAILESMRNVGIGVG